mgnify:CR=1 FL=1
MAKRFTDSNKFNDSWYRRLSPLHKVIWEYLLSECNHAGILKDLDLELMSFKIGNTINQEDLELLKKDGRITFLSETVLYIPKFITFQYGSLNPNHKVHASVIRELERYNINTLSLLYTNPCIRVKDKEKEKDIDKYMDMDMDTNIDINNFSEKEKEYINIFCNYYEKIFNKKCYLGKQEQCALISIIKTEPSVLNNIPLLLGKYSRIHFDKGHVTLKWLLLNGGWTSILNGEYDRQIY